MKALNSICKKDGKYVEVIEGLSVVENAVELLGGRRLITKRRRRMRNAEKGRGKRREEEGEGGIEGKERKERKERGEEEGNEGNEEEEECETEKGKKEERGSIVLGELRVREKIGLLELLSRLVKRGVCMRDEEDVKEVGMELEEEGNKHVEGEGGEGEEEIGEWEELSEKARNFVWTLKMMKARREGKKSQTLRMIDSLEKKDIKLEEANEKLEAAEKEISALKAELERSGTRKTDKGGEEKGEEKKTEIYGVNKVSEKQLLSEMQVVLGDWSILRKENNSIIHNSTSGYTSAFVSEKLNRSVHRMYEYLFLFFFILYCFLINQNIPT